MKKISFIITLLFLSIMALNAANARETYVDNKALCERTKGNWRLFNNNCADSCASKFETPLCTYHPAFTCDCGENRCWDGGKCVAEKLAKVEFDEKAAKLKAKREQELKEAGLNPDGTPITAVAPPAAPGTPQATPITQEPVALVPEVPAAPTKPIVKDGWSTDLPIGVSPAPDRDANGQEVMPETLPPGAVEIPEMTALTNAQKQSCSSQGGEWQQFNNGCADNCGSKITATAICTQVLTMGCKCGGTKCWDYNGSSCVELEDYKKNFATFISK